MCMLTNVHVPPLYYIFFTGIHKPVQTVYIGENGVEWSVVAERSSALDPSSGVIRMWVRIPARLVMVLVSLGKTLMGRKAVGSVCCVMHVKEPRTLIVKEKGLAPVFLDSRLEHPAGWICAQYKSPVVLLLKCVGTSYLLLYLALCTFQCRTCIHTLYFITSALCVWCRPVHRGGGGGATGAYAPPPNYQKVHIFRGK